MKTLFCLTLLSLLEVPMSFGAHGIYVPGLSPGNSSLAGPFQASPSSRVQQVYGPDGFPPIPDSAFLISGLYFRLDDEMGRPFNETFPSVQINFSTTSRGPDGLSTLFSENIGADETVVFGPGPLHLEAAVSWTSRITFDRPYLYNPAAGNLLMDIRNFGIGRAPPLDAFDAFGDSVSIMGNENVNSPVGETHTRGLATMFWADIVVIPEPGTITLLLLGALALGLGWRLGRANKAAS